MGSPPTRRPLLCVGSRHCRISLMITAARRRGFRKIDSSWPAPGGQAPYTCVVSIDAEWRNWLAGPARCGQDCPSNVSLRFHARHPKLSFRMVITERVEHRRPRESGGPLLVRNRMDSRCHGNDVSFESEARNLALRRADRRRKNRARFLASLGMTLRGVWASPPALASAPTHAVIFPASASKVTCRRAGSRCLRWSRGRRRFCPRTRR
jgi:hypothetical protein